MNKYTSIYFDNLIIAKDWKMQIDNQLFVTEINVAGRQEYNAIKQQ